MNANVNRRVGFRFRVPERVRLFFVRAYRSPVTQNLRNTLFEFYSYILLKPYFQYRLRQRSQPLKYLFILSPMRSGSSLLVHLLNSHPEIEGFGESHCAYLHNNDLERLIYRTAVIQPTFDFQNANYVMDKIVTNHDLSPRLLKNQKIKFIFLLRDPAASFNSAAKLAQSCGGLSQYQSFSQWFEYYQERLDFLRHVARQINDKNRCLFIKYEDLLHNTTASLETFQSFLQTKSTFSEDYRVSKNTGVLKYGDPSSTLKSGKIARHQQTANTHVFNEQEHALAYRTYANCVQQLTQVAEVVTAHALVNA